MEGSALHIKQMPYGLTIRSLEGDSPQLFRQLEQLDCLSAADVLKTQDGLWLATRSVADILISKGIETFPDEDGQQLYCSRFYDDWYLYAVCGDGGFVYSLFKLREQEYDAYSDIPGDGDMPGVTVSFLAMDTGYLVRCAADPTQENRAALNEEINRVVWYPKQRHDKRLKAYFRRIQACAPYLIAGLYVAHVASFARDGELAVPERYAQICQKVRQGKESCKERRLPKFIDENNKAAGYTVCDHETIYIRDPHNLTLYEKQAILATHTANVSVYSFAAEVRYHACYLLWWLRFPLPVLGKSIYESAVRADMTIGESELEGPAPFYRLDSRWVKQQIRHHKGIW